MAKRCVDCPTLTNNTRCTACQQQRDQRRNKQRGNRYGPEHRSARRAWEPIVATGTINCARCGNTIEPTQRWALDHLDNGTSAPSHGPCNEAAARRTRGPR